MNICHTTSYKLYNPKAHDIVRFSAISDLHFSYTLSNKKLLLIANKLTEINPNYILFPGDVIDSVDMIKDTHERKRLLSWLSDIATIAPTLISLGSHDYYQKKEHGGWQYHPDEAFYNEVNNLPNVSLLNNASYQDSDVFVTGITQSYAFYHLGAKHDENKEALITDLKSNLPQTIPDDKLALLLIHSPIHLADFDVLELLSKYDLVICGHMHNGCVPPIIYELWKTTRGFISPKKAFFPPYERNTLKTRQDKILVNGPLTMFQECTGPLQLANIIYPIYNSVIDYSNNPEDDTEKIKVKRKYQ